MHIPSIVSFVSSRYLLIILLITTNVYGQSITVQSTQAKDLFPLVSQNKAAVIYIDTNEEPVIVTAAKALQKDIQMVASIQPKLKETTIDKGVFPVIIGTVANNKIIQQLIRLKKIDVAEIVNTWERFQIAVVEKPFVGVEKALVIVGSDARGTAFGVFELSQKIGVSPWYWWADVTPKKQTHLFIGGKQISKSPSVKYRGIFLNDEDWGLQPWAAKKIDTLIKDIGPKTYAHIFELLLRLKANYIWPAMHPCTKAFYYYPENAVVANQYAIVVGSSHCEPMLRNNVFEWSENFKHEYGIEPKEWRYDLNKTQIATYWEDRIKKVTPYESVITVGMRGIHDGSMPGPKDVNQKVKLLENVITDQRSILTKNYQRSIEKIPQIFCPYKEVLQLYRKGLNLPDDVTIVWADDNFGYITQLSDAREQQRSGGSGVYYHLSYWGAPHDYLWLSTISPTLIGYEMQKAYEFGANRLWVFNVGDIKPAEMEMNFSLDMAYDITKWNAFTATAYVKHWATENFGNTFAAEIAAIKSEYYKLAQTAKPEHMLLVSFTEEAVDQRLIDYVQLEQKTKQLYQQIPTHLKDAFYQTILYPVEAASLMNQKILYAKKSKLLAAKAQQQALLFSNKATKAFENIIQITKHYNQVISNGKWNGIMSYQPRDLAVFKMPAVASKTEIDSAANSLINKAVTDIKISKKQVIAAADFVDKVENKTSKINTLHQLGLGGKSIALTPFTAAAIDSANYKKATAVLYNFIAENSSYEIVVKCLPTHAMNKDYALKLAISIDNGSPSILKFAAEANSKQWSKNVVNGFAAASIKTPQLTAGKHQITLYLLEPGVVINQIEIGTAED